MTAQEIMLVRESFRKLEPMADQAAALFYARLFELDPSMRRLFHSDMETQGRELMQMISTTLSLLDKPENLIPMLRQEGARYARGGVLEHHYATFGSALLWTLGKTLVTEFNPAVKSAWATTYSALAPSMIEGARAAAAAA